MESQTIQQRTTGGYIHPQALVETEQIGSGTRIWAFTHVSSGAVVGSNCNIGSHCYLESGVNVGDNVTIKNGNYLWAGINIYDGAFVGPQVVFTNDLHPRSPRMAHAASRYTSNEWLSSTVVEQGASIGAGAVILAGVSLGRFCMVAAGAVVTKTVPAHALVKGLPAKVSGWVCCCGEVLDFNHLNGTKARCERCLCNFEYVEGELRLQP